MAFVEALGIPVVSALVGRFHRPTCAPVVQTGSLLRGQKFLPATGHLVRGKTTIYHPATSRELFSHLSAVSVSSKPCAPRMAVPLFSAVVPSPSRLCDVSCAHSRRYGMDVGTLVAAFGSHAFPHAGCVTCVRPAPLHWPIGNFADRRLRPRTLCHVLRKSRLHSSLIPQSVIIMGILRMRDDIPQLLRPLDG